MITPKENLMRTIHWEKAEYVPLSWKAIRYVGGVAAQAVGPKADGFDIWGCKWRQNEIGAMNEPGWAMFEDISDWKDYVKAPNLDEIDFKALAEKEWSLIPPVDREQHAVSHISDVGIFGRVVYMIGYENTLIGMVSDPEAMMELMDLCTDYAIKYINKFINAYNPDIFTYGDDVATVRGLFMSPETYRTIIKPFHKRIVEAITARGVIPCQHCCGKTEELIDDYIEVGCKMWQSAEKSNDLHGILAKRQITVDGGWDFQGPPGYVDDTTDDDIIRNEVRRCLTEYKKPGYILWPTILSPKGNIRFYGERRMDIVIEEWEKLRWF